MSAIATYRTAVLALLDDPAKTRYTEACVDQGLRMALMDYTRLRPLSISTVLETDGNRVLSLPADLSAAFITQVELENPNPDLTTPIAFHAYRRDEQWEIDTAPACYPAGKTLIVTCSSPHTIDGLDNAAGTTIPPEDEPLLQIGATGYAAMARSSSRAETVNLQLEVSAALLKLAAAFLARFQAGMAARSGAFFAQPGWTRPEEGR